MTEKTNQTQYEFIDIYTLEEKYAMATSGEYGAFELYSAGGNIEGFRGFRKEHGTTGVYQTFREALEAAFIEYGDKK